MLTLCSLFRELLKCFSFFPCNETINMLGIIFISSKITSNYTKLNRLKNKRTIHLFLVACWEQMFQQVESISFSKTSVCREM